MSNDSQRGGANSHGVEELEMETQALSIMFCFYFQRQATNTTECEVQTAEIAVFGPRCPFLYFIHFPKGIAHVCTQV